ncbi:MAG: hypothetical protein AW09_000174 [Candidatus Accumulibacter phosphatis]|jgi:hypothetical protein|uniref:Uncharacterized protein n=1 Tax=Candidatus Accumulibacter phosphatis TaxID=327160 RepID=A0A080LZY5_9PROT|nr:MAG: hypothetical protein AW09_000174 [Candidatus Accumulibacter phosphatis]
MTNTPIHAIDEITIPLPATGLSLFFTAGIAARAWE